MDSRYTAPRNLATRIHRARGAIRRILRPLQIDTSGASFVEYLLIAGICAIGLIFTYRRYRAHSTVVVRNEAKIIATMDAPDPEAAILALGGFDRVRPLAECENGVCMIPGVECFGPGTLVATEAGDRAIETIRPGERVWSRDDRSGATELRPVSRVLVSEAPEVVEVALRSDLGIERLIATPDHLFWVEKKGWMSARSLGEARPLYSPSASVTAHVTPARVGPTTVYNLEVEGFHTYFVGSAHAWVHNDCPGTPEWDPQEDCIDKVLSLPHTRFDDSEESRRRLREMCTSGDYYFNEETKRLNRVGDSDHPPPAERYCYKQQARLEPAVPLDPDLQAALDERARLICAGESAAAGQVSDSIGNMVTKKWGDENFPASEGWHGTEFASGPNVFDHVYVNDDGRVVIIEAKGGDGRLSTRYAYGDRSTSVQQGTRPYAETIAQEMLRSSNPNYRSMGRDILDAIQNDKSADANDSAEPRQVEYHSVQQRAGDVDCTTRPPTGTAGRLEINEFAIHQADRAAAGC